MLLAAAAVLLVLARSGSNLAAGTSPVVVDVSAAEVGGLQRAAERVRQLATRAGDCRPVDVVLGPGRHVLATRLELGSAAHSGTSARCPVRWLGQGRAQVSSGIEVQSWRKEDPVPGGDGADTRGQQKAVDRWSAVLDARVPRSFWSVRGGGGGGGGGGDELAQPARWPSAQPRTVARPYLGGGFVYVSNVSDGMVHPYLGGLVLNVTVARKSLPTGWEQFDWRRANVMVWPGASWVSVQASARPLLASSAADDTFGHFQLHCRYCGPKSPSSGVQINSRFYFFGVPEFATEHGEWAVTGALTDTERVQRPAEWHPARPTAEPAAAAAAAAASAPRELVFVSAAAPQSVFVAGLVAPLVKLVNQSHTTFDGIAFVDADYNHTGVQSSFNLRPSSAGCPADGALVLSGSNHVTVSNCSFTALGGGGVLLANASADCSVLGSRFVGIGQSGVMLVGDAATQPRRITIEDNDMERTGAIMTSSAGVFITSGSDNVVRRNRIATVPRWGIAVRSNQDSPSANNLVELNTVVDSVLASKDAGGISFVDHTLSHNVSGNRILNNCVKRVLGLDTRASFDPPPPAGHTDGQMILRWRWCSYGIYLDDHSSGFNVSGNVLLGAGGPALVVHGGSRNSITNNVFANSTNAPGLDRVISRTVQRDKWGVVYVDASFGPRTLDSGTSDNELSRNIFLWSSTQQDYSVVGAAVPLAAATVAHELSGGIDSNLYYNARGGRFSATAPAFVNFSWAQWRSAGFGFDARSLQQVEPRFVDAAGGDWRLRAGSPALALGFQPLTMDTC